MEKLINIHTHGLIAQGAITILNRMHNEEIPSEYSGYLSMGLHPMHSDQLTPELLVSIEEQVISNKKIIAIGEIGLDKLCHVYLSSQITAFREQLKLADKHSLPCIIHNVRATDEILREYNQSGNSHPLIFHGFRGKPVIAKQILSAGGYLSFGRAITTKDDATIASFLKTPTNKLFLETDEATDVTIEEVYKAAAMLKQISEEELISEISTNFARLFTERE